MIAFLIAWAVALASLAAAVVGLGLIYRAAGSELGLDRWPKELVILLIASGLQAGAYVLLGTVLGGLPVVHGYLGCAQLITGFFIAYLCYLLGHYRDVDPGDLRPWLIPTFQVLVTFIAVLAISCLTGSGSSCGPCSAPR
jgi:hypothetical protein